MSAWTRASFRRWARLLTTAALVLASSTATATAAAISTPVYYSTSGKVDDARKGPVVSFHGLGTGTIAEEGPVVLGRFIIAPSGIVTTFKDVSFTVDFRAPKFDRIVSAAESGRGITAQYDGFFQLQGVLNGTVGKDGTSDLVATINGVSAWPKDLARTMDRVYLEGLPFPLANIAAPQTLDLSSRSPGGGDYLLTVKLVPEPGSVAVFLVLAAVGGAWRMRRAAC